MPWPEVILRRKYLSVYAHCYNAIVEIFSPETLSARIHQHKKISPLKIINLISLGMWYSAYFPRSQK